MKVTEPYWLWVNTGLGIGIVPLGNGSLPESMFNQFFVAIRLQYTTMI